jgi:hypothetical protein
VLDIANGDWEQKMARPLSIKSSPRLKPLGDNSVDDDEIPSLDIPPTNNKDRQSLTAGLKRGSLGKSLGYLVVSIACISGVAFLFISFLPPKNGTAVMAFNASRNYNLTPFDELDAQQICQHQSRESHGNQLVLSYLDTHSSRFEPRTGFYNVFLIAHIGTRSSYDEAVIHCYVDPQQHLINYYKTVYPLRASLMSRALKFFSK